MGKSEDIDSILRSALPDMTMVKSSNIYAIGYDAENQMMYVLFSRESPIIYRYQKVSAEDHKAVVEAESVGKEFAARVKNECAHQRLKMIGDGVAVEESSP